jgi:transcriptional regulator with XRE-family HTH domain
MSQSHPEQTLGAVLRSVMAQRGWTQGRFAEETGVDDSWVSRVLRRGKDPAFGRVLEVLGRAGYTLVLVDDASSRDGSCVLRRRILMDLGTVLGASQLRVAMPLAGGSELRTAEEVNAAAQRYVRLERELGGGVVYGPAVRVAQQLVRRVRSEKVSAAYVRAVGWYTHETAWLAYDSGQRGAARTYGSHALTFARKADDRHLQARAYNLLSLAATSVRDGQSGAELAKRGIAAAHEAGTEQTLLWARFARAEAVQGSKRESPALRALDRAEELAVNRRDVYEAVANRGIILAGLGRHDEARKSLAEAADIIGDLKEPRNRALYVARSAKVAVHQGELVEAASLVTQVLDEAEEIVSARIDKHLAEWMTLTEPLRIAAIPEIRAVRERVRDRVPPSAFA